MFFSSSVKGEYRLEFYEVSQTFTATQQEQ